MWTLTAGRYALYCLASWEKMIWIHCLFCDKKYYSKFYNIFFTLNCKKAQHKSQKNVNRKLVMNFFQYAQNLNLLTVRSNFTGREWGDCSFFNWKPKTLLHEHIGQRTLKLEIKFLKPRQIQYGESTVWKCVWWGGGGFRILWPFPDIVAYHNYKLLAI